MAKRSTSVSTRKAGNTEIVVVEPQPLARRSSRRRSGRRTSGRRRGRRGHSRNGAVGASLKTRAIGAAVGGFGVGFIEKQVGDKLPTLPIIGKKGAIAIAAYFFANKSEIARDVCISAAAISGYELGKSGVISGVGEAGLAAEL
jgi:hypothetical protein